MNIQVEWLSDGRTCRLLHDYEFRTKDGTIWLLPKDALVDGASIPRMLWSISGSPFVGKYRVASAFHDHHCVIRTHPYHAVHNMFWECMLVCGVDRNKADRMWWAVMTFGPKWDPKTGLDIERSAEEQAWIDSAGEEEW